MHVVLAKVSRLMAGTLRPKLKNLLPAGVPWEEVMKAGNPAFYSTAEPETGVPGWQELEPPDVEALFTALRSPRSFKQALPPATSPVRASSHLPNRTSPTA